MTCCEQENGEIRAEIANLRARDPLTGLYNRRHFYRMVNAGIRKRREGAVQALLYIRPDHFSAIDERFGPLASDALLKTLGHLIKDHSGKNSAVGRFGGNIFTALVLRKDLQAIEQLATDLVTAVSESVFVTGKISTNLTVSIGVAELGNDIEETPIAFSLAQKAARMAREEGGNQMFLHRTLANGNTASPEDRAWSGRIQAALASNRFQLVFQPIASLLGTADSINDVLVRMLDEGQQEILPGEFMPAAERIGMMPDIDKWILSRSFSVAARRESARKASTFLLRISEPTLLDPGFEQWLENEYKKHKMSPGTIVFQVSEATAENHIAAVKSLATCCQRLGCGIAIAHFGVSPDCIELLKKIPMKFLIIDGSFMAELEDMNRRLQLEQIIAVARELLIPTVATRVEDANELAVLCQLGIDFIQGYHLQQPDVDIADKIKLPGG